MNAAPSTRTAEPLHFRHWPPGHPHHLVEFVDALPKSGTGKVMWRALQEAEAAKTVAPSEA